MRKRLTSPLSCTQQTAQSCNNSQSEPPCWSVPRPCSPGRSFGQPRPLASVSPGGQLWSILNVDLVRDTDQHSPCGMCKCPKSSSNKKHSEKKKKKKKREKKEKKRRNKNTQKINSNSKNTHVKSPATKNRKQLECWRKKRKKKKKRASTSRPFNTVLCRKQYSHFDALTMSTERNAHHRK